MRLTARGWLEAASFVAFWACLLKVEAGAVAAATLPSLEGSRGGIPHVLPSTVSWTLGALAASLMGRESAPEQRRAAWILALAACAFADRPLGLAGWPAPDLEWGLAAAIPWALVTWWSRRPRLPSIARSYRRVLVSVPVGAALAVLPYYVLPENRWEEWPVAISGMIVYGGLVSWGIYASSSIGRLMVAVQAVLAGSSVALILAGLMMLL